MPASKRFKREAAREVRRLRSERAIEGASYDQMNEVVNHIMKALKIVSGMKRTEKSPRWAKSIRDIENGLTTERNAAMTIRKNMQRLGG